MTGVKRVLAFLLCAGLAGPVCAQEYLMTYSPGGGPEGIPLSSALRIGIENNYDLLRIQQNILIARSKVDESRNMRFPQANLTGSITKHDLDYAMVLPEEFGMRIISPTDEKNRMYGVGISAVQYLYSGGRISGAIKIAKSNLKSEESRYESVKNNVILNIKKSFYDLLCSEKKLAAARELAEKAEQYNKKLSLNDWDKISAGLILEKMRAAYENAKKEESLARVKLMKNMGRELNNPVKILGAFEPVKAVYDISKLQLWAMENRPEMKTAIFNVAAEHVDINLSLARKFPDVILGASFDKVGEDFSNDNAQVSLGVRFPLSYSYAARNAQQKARQRDSYLRRSSLEDEIHLQVLGSYENFDFWKDETVKRQSAYQTAASALAKAERGGKYGLSALQALDTFGQIYFSYLDGVRNNLSAKAELEWAVGRDL